MFSNHSTNQIFGTFYQTLQYLSSLNSISFKTHSLKIIRQVNSFITPFLLKFLKSFFKVGNFDHISWRRVGGSGDCKKIDLKVVRKDRVCFFANSAVVWLFFQEKINTYWNVEPSDD